MQLRACQQGVVPRRQGRTPVAEADREERQNRFAVEGTGHKEGMVSRKLF